MECFLCTYAYASHQGTNSTLYEGASIPQQVLKHIWHPHGLFITWLRWWFDYHASSGVIEFFFHRYEILLVYMKCISYKKVLRYIWGPYGPFKMLLRWEFWKNAGFREIETKSSCMSKLTWETSMHPGRIISRQVLRCIWHPHGPSKTELKWQPKYDAGFG